MSRFSDGVHRGLSDATLREILVRRAAPDETAREIVAQAIAARGAASAGPSFASTIRQWVLVAQPVFNQRKRVELATALAPAQLRQNLVGEHT
jgi:hypothetical protein